MGCALSAMNDEAIEFKDLDNLVENAEIPVRPENRCLTDKKGFVLFGTALLILLPFLIYTMTKSDLRYLTYPSDDCGNFCGLNNTFIEGISCSGKDYSEKPYMDSDIRYNRYWCTETCDGSNVFRVSELGVHHKACVSEENALRVDTNTAVLLYRVRTEWWKFLLTVIMTIGLSVSTLLVLRYTPAVLVWSVIIFSTLFLIVVTGVLWYIHFLPPPNLINESDDSFSRMRLFLTVIWTIICVIILTVFLVLFKKIPLVIQLYKESTKVLAAMPQLLLIPIVTTLIQFLILGIFFITTFLWVFSSDVYQSTGLVDKVVRYYSPATIFTCIINFFVATWIMRIIDGIQYLIVSSSASIWFFTKRLDSPVLTSIKITMRYHLGTISFGSFLLVLFSAVQAILRPLCRSICSRCLIMMCCPSMEVILKFISENSYIQTGIHGQSFCKSAKRATKLLMENARSVIAVSCVGDFILVVMILLLTTISTAISFTFFMGPPAIEVLIPTLICFALNLVIFCITFSTFKIIINTLFICFCEDSVLNDGISKPYYMSTGLMEFVENSKKMYGYDRMG